MRIELLGPSGVGKTTVLRATEQTRTPERHWLGPLDVDQLGSRKPTAADLRASIDAPGLREFIDHCIAVAATAAMCPSQTVAALTILRKSCFDTAFVASLGRPVVHDELLLHRAFSLLPHARDPEAAAHRFFELAPLPEAAVVFRADVETILQRVLGREKRPNVYQGLDAAQLRSAIARCLDITDIAAEALKARGVEVLAVDTSTSLNRGVRALRDFIADHTPGSVMTNDIRERLRTASGSFRKKEGRHELRTRDVMYCAFSTPNFTVAPAEAQRDAAKRVAHFRLTADNVAGKTVLDLGSNAGAMLFQLSNFAPRTGLGIEYDQDKVDLANEIARYAGIPGIRFEQGDIDRLDAASVGVYDIVLALAIEGHVNDPERLYRFLGRVTGSLLCFEGNNKCDMKMVRKHLKRAGFGRIVDLGYCDDDRDPRNNRRPQLLAWKKQRRGLLARLRSAVGR